MKIASRNVNGIRAIVGKWFYEWVKQNDFDITKVKDYDITSVNEYTYKLTKIK